MVLFFFFKPTSRSRARADSIALLIKPHTQGAIEDGGRLVWLSAEVAAKHLSSRAFLAAARKEATAALAAADAAATAAGEAEANDDAKALEAATEAEERAVEMSARLREGYADLAACALTLLQAGAAGGSEKNDVKSPSSSGKKKSSATPPDADAAPILVAKDAKAASKMERGGRQVLAALDGLLAPGPYLRALAPLLDHDDGSVRRKALRLVAHRLRAAAAASAAAASTANKHGKRAGKERARDARSRARAKDRAWLKKSENHAASAERKAEDEEEEEEEWTEEVDAGVDFLGPLLLLLFLVLGFPLRGRGVILGFFQPRAVLRARPRPRVPRALLPRALPVLVRGGSGRRGRRRGRAQAVRDEPQRFPSHAPVVVIQKRRQRSEVRPRGEEAVQRGEDLPAAALHLRRRLRVLRDENRRGVGVGRRGRALLLSRRGRRLDVVLFAPPRGARLQQRERARGEIRVAFSQPRAHLHRALFRLGRGFERLRVVVRLRFARGGRGGVRGGERGGGFFTRGGKERSRREVLRGHLGGEPHEASAVLDRALCVGFDEQRDRVSTCARARGWFEKEK